MARAQLLKGKGKTRPRRGSATSRAPGRGARSRELRIVGGSWRGRRLRFPAATAALRPTPDRVRETLFNWLQGRVAGRRCLDLFAGSGALGLEALSRGAAEVVFVERDASAARALAERLAEWQASGARVECRDARRFLESTPQAFDIVFLDPPFAAPLLGEAAARLDAGGWLAPGALVYLECAVRDGLPQLPADWQCLRSGRAGEVGYHLFAKSPSGALSE